MDCGGKLQSNNQVVASQDRVILTRLKMLYFLFADRRRRRRRSQLVGAPPPPVKNTRRAARSRLIKTGAVYLLPPGKASRPTWGPS